MSSHSSGPTDNRVSGRFRVDKDVEPYYHHWFFNSSFTMRLLNTATKQLESFYGKDIPPYAILSHMWGKDGDEVLFKHIAGSENDRREGESRRGYTKVVAACKQAIKDGYGYIWIDTCCIDKESSAELSEAINSMYAWYRDSDICYAYLEDVRSDRSLQSDKNNTFKIVPFGSSRWFKRGWTLQELIAPHQVVFYSKDWVDIGTKATLQDTISDVTHIRVEMITGYDPKKASIAERMSWAAFRETTRDEDIAYCLMGIFGVNMSLLYGEGKGAFMRLQEEIMKVTDDHSIFAWTISMNTDRTAWDTRGMLADSPWNFRDTGNIVLTDDEGRFSPYSMTNQGLQIELLLEHLDNYQDSDLISFVGSKPTYRAILKCIYRDKDPTQRIIIYLQMVKDGRYVRIFPHCLDETDESPYEIIRNRSRPVLTSLLVIQVDTPRNNDGLLCPNIKILPTVSGFTYRGRGLVTGHAYPGRGYGETEVIIFDHGGKSFGIAIGNDCGIPWLDFVESGTIGNAESNVMSAVDPNQDIKEIIITEIRALYKKGGPRCNMVARHLDRLSNNISEDWAVDVSAKFIHRRRFFEVVIDIRRGVDEHYVHALTEELPVTGIVAHTKQNSPFNIHSPIFKKEGNDWSAAFNPKMERILDINLVHSLSRESSTHCVHFSPDGKYLAMGGDRAVQVYDVKTGIETHLLNEKTEDSRHNNIYSICFSPDGKLLVTGSEDTRIRIWDISKRIILYTFDGHEEKINSLDFAPDGQFIVSGSDDSTARIWKIADGTSRIIGKISYYSINKSIRSVAISPHGQFIAAGCEDATIWIWNIATSQLMKQLKGHEVDLYSVAFTPDGKGLLSAGWGGIMKYWNVNELTSGQIQRGRECLSGNSSRDAQILREAADEWSQCTMNFDGHSSKITSISVSHDGKWIVSAAEQGVLFWDSRDAIAQFTLHPHPRPRSVTSVHMSPAGNLFATCCENISIGDFSVRIWSYDTNLYHTCTYTP